MVGGIPADRASPREPRTIRDSMVAGRGLGVNPSMV